MFAMLWSSNSTTISMMTRLLSSAIRVESLGSTFRIRILLLKNKGQQFLQAFRDCVRVHDFLEESVIQDLYPFRTGAEVKEFALLFMQYWLTIPVIQCQAVASSCCTVKGCE